MKNITKMILFYTAVLFFYSCSNDNITQEISQDKTSEIHSLILDEFGLENMKGVEWKGKLYSLEKNNISEEESISLQQALKSYNSSYVDPTKGILTLAMNKELILSKAQVDYQQELSNTDTSVKKSRIPFLVGVDLHHVNGGIHIFKASRSGWGPKGRTPGKWYIKDFKLGKKYRNNLHYLEVFSWPLSSHRNFEISAFGFYPGGKTRRLSWGKRWNSEYFRIWVNAKNRRNINGFRIGLQRR